MKEVGNKTRVPVDIGNWMIEAAKARRKKVSQKIDFPAMRHHYVKIEQKQQEYIVSHNIYKKIITSELIE